MNKESPVVRAPGAAAPLEGRNTEWLLRAFAVLLYVLVVRNLVLSWWADPSRLTVLLLLVTEGYTLMLVLFARRAVARDMSPLAMLASLVAVFYIALLDADNVTHLVPESVGTVLMICAACWQFAAKFYLGRSFGVLPAQRGVVLRGPYRLMRHPMYFGYLIAHVSFLLANFSLRNCLAFAVLYAAQLYRIHREESVLSATSSEYREYRQRVRWRLLPFVY